MQHNDDVAFQRAILANPADTTLKLVYADWLQERGDPRAEYIRRQLELAAAEKSLRTPRIDTFPTSPQAQMRRQEEVKKIVDMLKLAEIGRSLDPKWIAFMQSLAQPFEPITFQKGHPGHPFTERVGRRGLVVTFESQYQMVDALDEELLSDLAFLTIIDWCACAHGAAGSMELHSFMCDLPAVQGVLRASDVLQTLKAADFQSEHIADLNATEIPYPGYNPYTVNDEIHNDFAHQYMFDRRPAGAGMAGTHEALRRYVVGRLWYVLLHTGERPCEMVTLLTVGQSL